DFSVYEFDAEQDAGPDDEERGRPPIQMRTSQARSSSSVSFALAFDRMFAIPKRIALAGAVSVVVVVSFTVFWLFSLRPAYVATGTLSPADVREIVQIASRQRWQ